jgi:hypothetical protein
MKAVNLRAEVFSKQQRAQLEVYSILVSLLLLCVMPGRWGAAVQQGLCLLGTCVAGSRGVGQGTSSVSFWR